MTTDPTGADPRMAAIEREALAADLEAAGWHRTDENPDWITLRIGEDVIEIDVEGGTEINLFARHWINALGDPWRQALAIIARHPADAATNGAE